MSERNQKPDQRSVLKHFRTAARTERISKEVVR